MQAYKPQRQPPVVLSPGAFGGRWVAEVQGRDSMPQKAIGPELVPQATCLSFYSDLG